MPASAGRKTERTRKTALDFTEEKTAIQAMWSRPRRDREDAGLYQRQGKLPELFPEKRAISLRQYEKPPHDLTETMKLL